MAKTNPFQFLQEVRNEASKVTWPSRRETLITTGLVLLMVLVSSLFFLFTDTVIRWGLGLILARRKPDYSPRYRVWGYPLVPAFFAIAALAVVVNQIASDPIDSTIGLAIVLAGLPLYLWLSRKSRVTSTSH